MLKSRIVICVSGSGFVEMFFRLQWSMNVKRPQAGTPNFKLTNTIAADTWYWVYDYMILHDIIWLYMIIHVHIYDYCCWYIYNVPLWGFISTGEGGRGCPSVITAHVSSLVLTSWGFYQTHCWCLNGFHYPAHTLYIVFIMQDWVPVYAEYLMVWAPRLENGWCLWGRKHQPFWSLVV